MIQTRRRERGDAVGEGECARVTAHEGRREVERLQLLRDRSLLSPVGNGQPLR